MTKKNVSVDSVIKEVDPARRALLKRSLIAGGIVALAAPTSTLVAQIDENGAGKGKAKAKAKGKAKGKAKAKGKGKGVPMRPGADGRRAVPEIDGAAMPLAVGLLGGVVAFVRELRSKFG